MTLRVDSIQRGSGVAASESSWKWNTHDSQGREAETAIAASLRRREPNPDECHSTILGYLRLREEIELRELAEKRMSEAKHKNEHEAKVRKEAQSLMAAARESEGLSTQGNAPQGLIESQVEVEENEGGGTTQMVMLEENDDDEEEEEEEDKEEQMLVEKKAATVDAHGDEVEMPAMPVSMEEDGTLAGAVSLKPRNTSNAEAKMPNESPPPGKTQAAAIDQALVAKCLASNVELSPELVISIFDYGGQQGQDISTIAPLPHLPSPTLRLRPPQFSTPCTLSSSRRMGSTCASSTWRICVNQVQHATEPWQSCASG